MKKYFSSFILISFLISSFALGQGFFTTGFWNGNLRLAFSSSAQTAVLGVCSGTLTISRRHTGNVGVNLSYVTTVDLTAPAGVTFYSDASCALPITSVTIPINNNVASFYILSTTPGVLELMASAETFTSTTQAATISASNGFIWTGTSSTVFSTAGNWSGGVAPGTSDVAIFDGSCTTNCSPTFTQALDIKGIRMEAGYSGTIAQGAFNIQLRSGGLVIKSGTFTSSNDPTKTFTLAGGNFAISAGTFTAPASSMLVSGGWIVTGSPTVNIPTDSTIEIRCTSSSHFCYGSTMSISSGTVAYENINLYGQGTNWSVSPDNPWTINKNFQFGDLSTGVISGSATINIKGNITQVNNGQRGNSTFVAAGNVSGQTITGTSGFFFPRLEVAAGANPVTFSGTIQLQSGFKMTSVGTFTSTGSTLAFDCTSSSHECYSTTMYIEPNTVTYNNVTLMGRGTVWNINAETWNIGGSLTFGDYSSGQISNGNLRVNRDVTVVNNGDRGTAWIILTGNALGQTVAGNGMLLPKLEVDAGANPVTFTGTILLQAEFYMTSVGVFTATGSTLEFICTTGYTCYSSTTVIRPGTVKYNNFTLHGRTTTWSLDGQTLEINGTFTFGDVTAGVSITNGTIKAYGPIVQDNNGNRGTATLVVAGNAGGQTVTGTAGRLFPSMEIAAGANDVTFAGTIQIANNFTMTSVGTFTTTGSTLEIGCASNYSGCYNSTITISPGTKTYNDVILHGKITTYDLSGSTFKVGGHLTFGDNQALSTMTNGTIEVSKNITQDVFGYRGDAVIKAVGNAAGQTITGNGGGFPVLAIAAGVNPITLSGTIKLFSDYIVTSMGALTSTGSTLTFSCVSASYICFSSTVNITPGTGTYNTVSIIGRNTTWELNGATFKVGALSIGDSTSTNKQINNGTFEVSGDFSMLSNGNTGTAALTFVGSATQYVAAGVTMPTGTVTVNKTGGSVTLLTNASWNTVGQALTIQGRSINMAGYNLIVGGMLTLNTGTSITRGGGSLTYGSITNNGTINP